MLLMMMVSMNNTHVHFTFLQHFFHMYLEFSRLLLVSLFCHMKVLAFAKTKNKEKP